jgi:hypothetical protein
VAGQSAEAPTETTPLDVPHHHRVAVDDRVSRTQDHRHAFMQFTPDRLDLLNGCGSQNAMYDSIVGELCEQTFEFALVESVCVFPDGRREMHVGTVPKSVAATDRVCRISDVCNGWEADILFPTVNGGY